MTVLNLRILLHYQTKGLMALVQHHFEQDWSLDWDSETVLKTPSGVSLLKYKFLCVFHQAATLQQQTWFKPSFKPKLKTTVCRTLTKSVWK